MSSRAVINALRSGLDRLPAGPLVVGFSGGLDSTVLLHALAALPEARERGLRAIHVDHRLHADSESWAAHAARIAAQFDVVIVMMSAGDIERSGRGIEAAARRARYDAFADVLRDGEILALAHHADDQSETVLLKLLRGAGPEGLAGMRSERTFGRGRLWRPLLEVSRAQLHGYAMDHALHWIEDPSNANTRLRRNFLRAEILPRLALHWPDASAAIAHSARWSRAAADFVAQHARIALAQVQGVDPSTLAWRRWLELPGALRDPVLRLWLRSLGFAEPAHFQVAELERQLGAAGADATPCVRFEDCELRRYRDLLHAMAPLSAVDAGWQAEWQSDAVALPAGGMLAWTRVVEDAVDGASDYPALLVRYRHGGERMRPHGSEHVRALRTLLQEHGIPPWQRDRVPLVYAGDELIAAGDLLVSSRARQLGERLGARISWLAP